MGPCVTLCALGSGTGSCCLPSCWYIAPFPVTIWWLLLYRVFDATRGFPGEGPFSLRSHNVGSLAAHPELYSVDAHLFLVQEARLSADNVRSVTFRASEAGRSLLPGPLLPVVPDVNGVRRVEWGGVASLAWNCSSAGCIWASALSACFWPLPCCVGHAWFISHACAQLLCDFWCLL